MKYTPIIMTAITAAMYVIAAVVYPHMPSSVASHWDITGRADGHMSRSWGTFLLPTLQTVVLLLYLTLPRIDPLRANIASFRKRYDLFWIFLSLFFAYLSVVAILWNLGHPINMSRMMLPAVSVLLFVIGYTSMEARQNWFFGIRTPWTLASEATWKKTHAFGGRLFMYLSWVPLLGFLTTQPELVHILILAPIIVPAAVSVVYSYIIYRKGTQQ